MSEIPRVGALARWTEEMRRGVRGHLDRPATWRTDDLWSAACHEKAAIELEAQGDTKAARHFMDLALLRLNGSRETTDSLAGKTLLARLGGTRTRPTSSGRGPWAGLIGSTKQSAWVTP